MIVLIPKIELKAKLINNLDEEIAEIIQTYNDTVFNYVVVVLNFAIHPNKESNNECVIMDIIPNIEYIVPFITTDTTTRYLSEISNIGKVALLIDLKPNKIIVCNN